MVRGGEVRGAHLTFVLWRACLLNPPWQFVSDVIGNLILRGRSWEDGLGGRGRLVNQTACVKTPVVVFATVRAR